MFPPCCSCICMPAVAYLVWHSPQIFPSTPLGTHKPHPAYPTRKSKGWRRSLVLLALPSQIRIHFRRHRHFRQPHCSSLQGSTLVQEQLPEVSVISSRYVLNGLPWRRSILRISSRRHSWFPFFACTLLPLSGLQWLSLPRYSKTRTPLTSTVFTLDPVRRPI